MAGRLKSRERTAALHAAERLIEVLASLFPDYRFRVEHSRRRDIGEYRREESSQLLRAAAESRTVHRWDFVFLVTPDELIARLRSYAFAALSRPLDAAVVSTSRLVPSELSADPHTIDETPTDEVVIDRLATIFLHAIAHIAGVPASRDSSDYLYHPQNVSELDAMARFSDSEHAELDEAFRVVADTRLEEYRGHDNGTHRHRWRFNLRAAWKNREGIADAVRAARPWEFPIRLSRLTTAAVSTLTVLLMTAEAWDLALSQSQALLICTAVLVLTGTTLFVVSRQNLMMRRHHELREQLVVSRTSALLIVISGLGITWLGILVLALCAAATVFSPEVITHWAASSSLTPADVGTPVYWQMATFCASLGLLIGSLGASFEDQWHFQHVIFVDEEL